MASVTFPIPLGGDGSTVTDDSNVSTGLANGGHRTRFVPALSQMVNIASTFVNAAANTSADIASPGRNKILNGDFVLASRGTTLTSPSSGDVLLDGWKFGNTTAATVTVTQDADRPTLAQAGVYTPNCMKVAITGADTSIAASEALIIVQNIEGQVAASLGFGQGVANNIRLVFWVKGSKTGTYSVSIRNSAANRSYIKEFTINSAATWEKKSLLIPVDVANTWLYDTGIGVKLTITLASGPTLQTTANTWVGNNYIATASQVNLANTVGDYIKLSQVSLSVGDSETIFIPSSLIDNYRYFKKLSSLVIGGYAAAGGTIYVPIPHNIPMRVAPTVSIISPGYSNASGLTTWVGSDNIVTTMALTITTTGYGYSQCALDFNAML